MNNGYPYTYPFAYSVDDDGTANVQVTGQYVEPKAVQDGWNPWGGVGLRSTIWRPQQKRKRQKLRKNQGLR